MVFILMLVLVLVGIGVLVVAYHDWDDFYHNSKEKTLKKRFGHFLYYCDEGIAIVGWIATIIFAIVSIVMLFVIIDAHSGLEAKRLQMQETYKALSFKAQSECARDEFGLLNKEIVDEIQDWNEDLVYDKAMQDNFWVGIFYSDIYDELETIDFEQMKE